MKTLFIIVVSDAVYLNIEDKKVSELLISIGSTVLGALAGLLAPSLLNDGGRIQTFLKITF